ncbi:MAG: hypothetical protein V3T85_13140, partial [Acidiferrobacterales bacterium]
ASLHFSPGIVARARKSPWLQGARVKTRGHGVYYVEPTTERNVSTTPGMEDDCMDAGGRATQGAVAEVESRREQRPRYAAAVDSW